MYQQSIFSTKGNTFDSFKLNAPQKSTFLKLVFNAIHQESLTDKDKRKGFSRTLLNVYRTFLMIRLLTPSFFSIFVHEE